MSTWEERMAQKAAARKPVESWSWPERNENDEAAIAQQVPNWTPEAIAAQVVLGCACVGPPPGCTLCYCHLRNEAIARAEGEPCRWHGCEEAWLAK